MGTGIIIVADQFCLELAENAEKKKKYFWLKS